MHLIPYAIHLYTYKNTWHANIHDMACHTFTQACHVTHKKAYFLKLFLICNKKFFLNIAEFEAGIVKFCYNTPSGVLKNKNPLYNRSIKQRNIENLIRKNKSKASYTKKKGGIYG